MKNSSERFFLSLYNQFRDLILYGVIGTLCAGLDFFIFSVLESSFGVFYIYANILSVGVGISTSFFLNRKYNFKVNDRVFNRFAFFLAIGLSGLFISSWLLYFFIDVITLDKIISKLLSIIFVVILQFLLNKFITFRKVDK